MTVSPVDEPLLAAFRASGAGVERVNGHLVLTTRDLGHLNALVDTARAQGGVLSELSPMRSSLEDVFVDLVRTGEEKDEALSHVIPRSAATRNLSLDEGEIPRFVRDDKDPGELQ
jgi:hypothetical protein